MPRKAACQDFDSGVQILTNLFPFLLLLDNGAVFDCHTILTLLVSGHCLRVEYLYSVLQFDRINLNEVTQ